jgi:aminoglycoside phosphotransferase (APT) family kinase protein
VGTNEAAILLLNWWTRLWAEDLNEEDALMTLTEAWLQTNAPVLDQFSIVPGDFRTGNFLFDEQSRNVTAVLD